MWGGREGGQIRFTGVDFCFIRFSLRESFYLFVAFVSHAANTHATNCSYLLIEEVFFFIGLFINFFFVLFKAVKEILSH